MNRKTTLDAVFVASWLFVANVAVAQQDGHSAPDEVAIIKTEKKPQWEFGLAAAGLSVPAYPASGVTGERRFLVPWFVYRGDKVRLQDGGLKLIALENQRVTIDVSISGSLNADSQDTPLRQNMPDLDYLLELGPKVDVRLWDQKITDDESRSINWTTALRLAVSTDFSAVTSRGPVLGSQLSFRHSGLYNSDTFLSVAIDSFWVGEKLMDYFYQIDPEFVTPQRAAYDAKAGYIGSGISLSIGHNFNDRVSGFVGLKLALHEGARNRDSPLFEDSTGNSIYGGLSWTIRQSNKTIDVVVSDSTQPSD